MFLSYSKTSTFGRMIPLLVLAVTPFVALTQAMATPVVLDTVVAVADDEPILSSDLRKHLAIQRKGAAVNPELAPSPEVKRALQELVLEKLLRKEAEELGFRVGEEEINAYIAEIKRQNQVDDEGLQRMLSEQGLTLDDYKKQVVNDITRARIISSRVRAKVNVTDQDIEKYVSEHPQSAPREGSRRVEQVLIRFLNEGDQDGARERAQVVREQLAAGKMPDAQGGVEYLDLGYVDTDDLREDLRDAAAKLSDGGVSEAVLGEAGFTVVRVSKPAETAHGALDPNTRERIKRQIYDSKMKEQLDRFLNDELLTKYHVEYKL